MLQQGLPLGLGRGLDEVLGALGEPEPRATAMGVFHLRRLSGRTFVRFVGTLFAFGLG